MLKEDRQIRVLIVYPFLFHYRFGVFKALETKPELDVIYVSDIVGHQGIAATPASLMGQHERVKTFTRSRFTWQKGLLALIARRPYDAVIFHGDMWSVSTWIAAAVARIRRRKVYFWTIGWHRPDPTLLRQLRVAFYKLADELLVYGNIGRDLGARMGYPAARMHVIYNSHESSQQVLDRPGEASVDVRGSSTTTVGAVIRLTAVKKLDLLLEAAALLQGEGSPIRVVLAGEGPERGRLEDLAKTLDVEIVFTGAIYSESDLEAFYNAVDVTVVPAAAGLTVIQSLSYGVLVVTDDDDYGQMPEAEAVIDGLTGARYAKGSTADLAEKIKQVIERVRTDPAGTSAFAKREVTLRWTPEAQARSIYNRLVSRRDHADRD